MSPRIRQCLALAFAALACPSALPAQYELKGGVSNNLSLRIPAGNPARIPPVGSPATPTGDPTITPQYANTVESSGNAGPTPSGFPSNGSTQLRRASIGTTFASGVPRYFYGDTIAPPDVVYNQQGSQIRITDPASYWRAQPVAHGEVLTNPSGNPATDFRTGDPAQLAPLPAGVLPDYYYSPHARRVLANTPGTIAITWRSSSPDPVTRDYLFYRERFVVSSATSAPVRTIFWTEKSFNGPRVTIPSGRIVTANPIYSNVFPEVVPEEVTITGTSQADPNASATRILRTLWFDKTNGSGELHAYNVTGRLLVEYLGQQRSDGTHEFLGADIVSVERAATPTTITVTLGREIRPSPEENLIAVPVTNASSPENVPYYGSHTRADGTLAYYAERENTIEDRVVFYWMESRDAAIPAIQDTAPGLSINWPKSLGKYLQLWPTTVTDYASYTVPHGGSSVANGTGLRFEGGKIPAIIHQDSATAETVVDTVSQRLVVNLGSGGDQANRSLLKFTGNNGGVWYVPLLTQAENRSGFLEGDGSAPLSTTAYVGERILPPSPAYSHAGYLAAGSAFSPAAYRNPFTSGIPDAERGAIIPVNALPESLNPLTIWWFSPVKAPSPEFADFYTPSKIGRYSVAYRTSIAIASESFDATTDGWSNSATASIAGSPGRFLGNHGASPQPTPSKTFSMNGRDAGNASVSFTFHRIDSWENESFSVSLNGSTVLSQPFSSQEVRETLSGSTTVGYSSYLWSIRPIAGSFRNFFGSATPDQSFTITITASTPTSKAPTQPTLAITLGSSLNQPPTDESFGIDDLRIDAPLPNQIILASNEGSGSLPPEFTAGSVYHQPDPAKAGYNPNEEHALLLNGRAYALRDDLNLTTGSSPGTTFSSLPRVLLAYTDPADQRPAMAVYEVLRENSSHRFAYPITAATIVSAPMPLPLLPLPTDNSGKVLNREVAPDSSYPDPPPASGAPASYTPFTLIDRKGYHWVYRGPHQQGSPSMGMQFHYAMRSDFAFPNLIPPPVGTPIPYLRPKDASGNYIGHPFSGTPLTIQYFPAWPDNPPTLTVGESLTLPRRGLPAIRGQSSATIVYQQSIATTSQPSVVLHDPTRAKSVLLNQAGVGLTALPASLKTTQENGKTYFQLAQPHLQQRFYFDPLLGDIGGLVLTGEFHDVPAGEDFLHLNTLSPEDSAALISLVDPGDKDLTAWKAAIASLATTIETFTENPAVPGTYIPDNSRTTTAGASEIPVVTDPDTATDSYALTAQGLGSGYVSLLFGNGRAFTPTGEPVTMQIIKVTPELYQGDLKRLTATNPLDEQTTIRHSGDFAARPDLYEFEWRYSPPIGGTAPPIYETEMKRVLGNPDSNAWLVLPSPQTSPPDPLPFPSQPLPFERSLQINTASYNPASGLPGTFLSSTSGLTFPDSIPPRIIFSAKLPQEAGLALYLNNSPVLAYQIPPGFSSPGNLPPAIARSGLTPDALPLQFEIDRSLFRQGENTITIALYSPVPPGSAASPTDFRFHAESKKDLVDPEDNSGSSPWIAPTGTFSNSIVIGGSAASPLGDPLLVFSDAYFTMRYRARKDSGIVTGSSTSEWSQPVLVESWVKRVLDGINPFNQRQTDLYNNPVSTDVSLLTQAGTRWEGDVALSLASIDDFGLIEIYETVLNRVRQQSLDAGISTESVNSTLLLVAGYLHDLYMTLGNEAWDDAANPTLQVASQSSVTDIETSRFSFEGQVPSLMEETLALLRGRDDFLSPGTTTAPAYNRLYWNYTNGINSGEPFYATNYGISEMQGGPASNGSLDAADAQLMFPQGHGDAYGHYLTALKGYYQLLTAKAYDWTPTTEGVSVLGQTVQVDYSDERKFAAAAAALARTSTRILDLTARLHHQSNPAAGWSSHHDGKTNTTTGRSRHWGTDEWAARSLQGAYFHWVTANAILPSEDIVHEGIQKIDRSTVPEIREIATSASRILSLSAGAQAHLNPLGLPADAMVFDLSPAAMNAGASHFDQIYDRAIKAASNAALAYREASQMNGLLRRQNENLDEYNAAVQRQERAYQSQLITLYGTPYSGDIGPGRLYAQNYAGPDLYHPHFIDRPSQLVDTSRDVSVSFREPINTDPFREWSVDNAYQRLTVPSEFISRPYRINPFSLAQFADTTSPGLGKRAQTGAIQAALLDCYEAQTKLREASDQFTALQRRFDRDYQLYSEFITDYDDANKEASRKLADAAAMTKAAFAFTTTASGFALSADFSRGISAAISEGSPQEVGMSNDVTSAVRMTTLHYGETIAYALALSGLALESRAALLEAEAADLEGQAQSFIDDYNFDSLKKQHVVEFERLYDQVLAAAFSITEKLTDLQRANEKVSRLYGEASQLLAERETFRLRAASVIQGFRTRDLVYRELRNEQLEQYQSLFDLAQTYTYCTAKAYDYETGLLSSPTGAAFTDRIIQSHSLGSWNLGNPITKGPGDPGLASILGSLRDDWAVARGRLGINNPDRNGTLFSLRQELFRIPTDQATQDDNLLWKQVLQQHIRSNLLTDPDAAIYCANLRKPDGSPVPGFLIPFSTTIQHGLNFFGWPLAPGDHAFSPSHYSTKIFAAGLVFRGYVGMDPYAHGTPGAAGPASAAPDALSATPYAYLIPTGQDTLRIPPLGDSGTIRSWQVQDQALPLPRNLGAIPSSGLQLFTPQGTLNEELWIRRKYQAFRPVDDPAYFYSSIPAEFTSSRLIGRSAWNSQWKLIIPAYSLLQNENDALDRFARSVRDIGIFLRTYSHAGN